MHVLKRFTENHFPKSSTQLFLKKSNIDVGSLQGKEKKLKERSAKMIFALEQTNRTENHLLKWILPRFCLGFPEEFGKVLQMSADHQDTFPNNSTLCHTYEGNKNILERLERLEKFWKDIDTTRNKYKFVFFPLATTATSYDLATLFDSFHLPW